MEAGMTRHVLVPMDGSPQARNGLRHALSEYPKAEIAVLHVIEPIESFYRTPELSDWKQWCKNAEKEANEIFADAQAVADEYTSEVTYTTMTGRPVRAIVDYIEDEEVDHVIMGSHGRAEDARVQLGSVAEMVVRRSPVLVTVIR